MKVVLTFLVGRLYLYGYGYVLAEARAARNICHKMDTCILGYECGCAWNRPAWTHKFSRSEDICELSYPPETCERNEKITHLGRNFDA